MKTKLCFVILLSSVFFLFSCGEKHLIKNDAKRQAVEQAFAEKKAMFGEDNEIFDVFNEDLTTEEREALEFIYAYAPLNDLPVSKDLYLDLVRTTLQAREEMPWASSVPEDYFLHFVLPPRVNNEPMDSSRKVFYNELKDRVKGLSIKDAALEVNHWCHEKGIYQPTDGRTVSPLGFVKIAYGRCGEESVFAVAALRSVGIPARSVYTMRWAHCDSNHAWVEVWGGDKWYYLGACEPEPRLDMAWFTAPAKRGMLMGTKVYGDYQGPEEVLTTNPSYTEINITSNYAPVKKVDISIVDVNGNPVPYADVEFKIYNGSSFSNITAKKADENGKTVITFGLGDALIWASKDNQFGYEKLSVPTTDNLVVKLDKKKGDAYTISMDIVPPVEIKASTEVPEEEVEANAARMAQEDSIRGLYIATFMNDEQIDALAEKIGVKSNDISNWMKTSRGNHDQIEEFLVSTPKENLPIAFDLLNVLPAKDLMDMSAATLKSHLNGALKYKGNYKADIFNQYLLNPRVTTEWIEAYRDLLPPMLGQEMTASDLIKFTQSVTINDEMNYSVGIMAPSSVVKLKMTDTKSRDAFFVAAARTYGIPSRLDPVTGKVQYYDADKWVDVDFAKAEEVQSPKGTLTLTYKPIKAVKEAKPGSHFSLAKIDDNGRLQSIGLRGKNTITMGKPFTLDTGTYMLTAGTRLASGAILTNVTFFEVKEGQNTKLPLVLRENDDDIFVIGTINAEAKMSKAEDMSETTLINLTGRGYYILALIEAKKEPTNHSLQDMVKLRNELTQWGCPIVMAFKNEEQYKLFNPGDFGQLPEIKFAIDSKGEIENMFKGLDLNTSNLPIYVIADSFGRVVYKSEGYQINLGDHIMNVISKL